MLTARVCAASLRRYMAPEAINNKFATHHADLWSFGSFIAQIVTGAPIFKGGSDYLTFKRVLARKYMLLEGTPDVVADLIDKLCQLEPSGRLGGAANAETDAVDPASISGLEPRPLGHSALWAHPFFRGLPSTNLHREPVPQPSADEIELNELVRKIGTEGLPAVFGPTPQEAFACVAGWSQEYKTSVAFETAKRELLSSELRFILGMPPPPPPIVVRARPPAEPPRQPLATRTRGNRVALVARARWPSALGCRALLMPHAPLSCTSHAPLSCASHAPLSCASPHSRWQDDLTEELAGRDNGDDDDDDQAEGGP